MAQGLPDIYVRVDSSLRRHNIDSLLPYLETIYIYDQTSEFPDPTPHFRIDGRNIVHESGHPARLSSTTHRQPILPHIPMDVRSVNPPRHRSILMNRIPNPGQMTKTHALTRAFSSGTTNTSRWLGEAVRLGRVLYSNVLCNRPESSNYCRDSNTTV